MCHMRNPLQRLRTRVTLRTYKEIKLREQRYVRRSFYATFVAPKGTRISLRHFTSYARISYAENCARYHPSINDGSPFNHQGLEIRIRLLEYPIDERSDRTDNTDGYRPDLYIFISRPIALLAWSVLFERHIDGEASGNQSAFAVAVPYQRFPPPSRRA